MNYLRIFMRFVILYIVNATEFSDSRSIAEVISQPSKSLDYFIIAKRVSWSQAKSLCPGYEKSGSRTARLASLENEEDRKWLAKRLSESDNRYDELWIDGRRESAGANWTWVKNNRIINDSAVSYPEWYNVSSDKKTNCLAFARLGHDMPIVVPSDCRRGKPFLCIKTSEYKSKTEAKNIKEGVSLVVDGFNYTLYGINETSDVEDDVKFSKSGVGRLNGGGIGWREARIECRKRGQHLASILSNEAAAKVADVMLKSRPSIESAWLGGWSSDGLNWIWSDSGVELSSHKSPESLYPPWLPNHPNPPQNPDEFVEKPKCLILDRHTCPENVSPVFLDLDCDKERPFVCQHDFSEEFEMSPTAMRQIPLNDSLLEVSESRMTWEEGNKYCQNKSGVVASIFNNLMLISVLEKMTELHLQHLWIGGSTKKSKESDEWMWLDELGNEITRSDFNEALAWCFEMSSNNYINAQPNYCLNLDREAQGLPIFYGLPCESIKQNVLCRLQIEPASMEDGKKGE